MSKNTPCLIICFLYLSLTCFSDDINHDKNGFFRIIRWVEKVHEDELGRTWISHDRNLAGHSFIIIKNQELQKEIESYMYLPLLEGILRCLVVCDINNDGKIQQCEWPNRQSINEIIRKIHQNDFLELDKNHNGILEREERCFPSNSCHGELEDILSQWEWDESRHGMQLSPYDFVCDGTNNFIDHICAISDRDHNGWLDIDERRNAVRLSIQEYDSNHDNFLDIEELGKMYNEAMLEAALWQLCPEVDKDGDQWLSKEEKEIVLKKVLPVYDINQDGRLDEWEQWTIVRDGWDCWPAENQIKKLASSLNIKMDMNFSFKERQKKLFAAAGEKYGTPQRFDLRTIFYWGRDKDEIAFKKHYPDLDKRMLLEFNSTYYKNLFRPHAGKEEIQLFWKSLSTQYDFNHDGKINYQEFFWLNRNEILHTTYGMDPVRLIKISDTDIGLGKLTDPKTDEQYFELLDSNKDGFFSCREESACLSKLKEGLLKERVINSINKNYPNTYNDNGEFFNPEDGKKRYNTILKQFDIDQDGKIDMKEVVLLGKSSQRKEVDNLTNRWFAEIAPFLADLDDDGKLTSTEEKELGKVLFLLLYDHNASGNIDPEETYLLIIDLALWQLKQRERQKEAEKVKKYDLNGNGKLDPEERTRAEQDAKAGIQAPAIDE